ncbi:MarR family winged helix-turn-helix transcriptional regulator [Gordonia sp. GONU]|uniref:MarR family winged helix-turn-helix transcriptional regulator n=1 Tax=Gordonia TaxID=2053 RepID=UPI000407895E|nr:MULTISPECIES: MarR family winged helix-turn-helix transcriptional regulator [Gordonia]MCR8895815.1 MarR family winged helix-turn-helix transcriptional regulator [Gordonia sp. GONU]
MTDPTPAPLSKDDFVELARFRFGIRRYLRFSERTVRSHGLTPQQYQLLLALLGEPGREWATIQELADRLLVRHHSAVELVDRAQERGLVRRSRDPEDARRVRVQITTAGWDLMSRLSAMHRNELQELLPLLNPPARPIDDTYD